MAVLSFYQPGERFATMTAGHVAKIWRVNVDGMPIPEGASRTDEFHPDQPDGYRAAPSRPIETTPELPMTPEGPGQCTCCEPEAEGVVDGPCTCTAATGRALDCGVRRHRCEAADG